MSLSLGFSDVPARFTAMASSRSHAPPAMVTVSQDFMDVLNLIAGADGAAAAGVQASTFDLDFFGGAADAVALLAQLKAALSITAPVGVSMGEKGTFWTAVYTALVAANATVPPSAITSSQAFVVWVQTLGAGGISVAAAIRLHLEGDLFSVAAIEASAGVASAPASRPNLMTAADTTMAYTSNQFWADLWVTFKEAINYAPGDVNAIMGQSAPAHTICACLALHAPHDWANKLPKFTVPTTFAAGTDFAYSNAFAAAAARGETAWIQFLELLRDHIVPHILSPTRAPATRRGVGPPSAVASHLRAWPRPCATPSR